MTVSELIDMLRDQERDGRGDADVVLDGESVVGMDYDRESDSLILETFRQVTSYEDLLALDTDDVDEDEESYVEEWDA